MGEHRRFDLPDIGEGLIEADLLQWYVGPGDAIEVNQAIAEIETAKAIVELPSPYRGTVVGLHVPEGTTVDVGTPIITIDVAGEREDEPMLVGYGAEPAVVGQRPSAPAGRTAAVPPVRKLARDLGVDLTAIRGSGPDGSITREDVRRAVAVPAVASDREERVPIRGVRKHTAAAMVRSAFTAPHVTTWLQVDATELMDAVRRLRGLPEFAGLKVSPLLLVARALLVAVARHPMINAAWDEDAQEIVVKYYVNLGIAVATERGLLVPSIKDAHAMSCLELARALRELTVQAREGQATPRDLAGGTITITNGGVFGIDGATPILTPGESATLAFGQVRPMPWVHNEQIEVRQVTTLALSFDHRVVDGELGSAVLRDVGAMLEDPIRLLAWS